MTWCNEKNCVQKTKVALLEEKNETMSKNVEKILTSIEKIEKFILTSPQKFADKEKTEKFMNWVNLKLAFVSWIIWLGLFVADKYL